MRTHEAGALHAVAGARGPTWLREPADVNALLPRLWPRNVGRGPDGSLTMAGVPVTAIAERFGTPAYVVDEDDFRSRAREFRTAFGNAFAGLCGGADVYYAAKAFLCRATVRWVAEEGLHIDVCTGGELAVVQRAGFPAGRIGLHGNNKSETELARAVDAGVGRIVVDSQQEIERLARLAADRGVKARVMVRLTVGVEAHTHEYIATAHEDQKFGLSVNPVGDSGSPAMNALLAVLKHPELKLLGIHSHIGSQILDPDGFEAAARVVLRLRADLAERSGVLVDEVDLGGGYGIAYLPGDIALDPERVAKDIAQSVAGVCQDLGTSLPRFSIEPGRAIVGPAGLTLYTVGTVKPVTVSDAGGGAEFVRTYVSIDGGMSDNIRPALYGAAYHAEVVGRSSTAESVLARVVGKHCESGDIVVHEVQLPADARAGDLLAVAATGAYGRSMASNYNMLPRPPVVAVSEGASRVLVRRETEDDLLSLDQG